MKKNIESPKNSIHFFLTETTIITIIIGKQKFDNPISID